jgi:hypothetical protein
MERLTLEEAIVHTKEVADMNYNDAEKFDSNDSVENYMKANCIKCAEEHEQLAEWLEKLKSYKDAEEQGLLVRLPCKVGDTVYVPTRNFVSELRITMVSVDMHEAYFSWMLNSGIYPNLDGFSKSKLGKSVFLTREEAEKKLEEMKAND